MITQAIEDIMVLNEYILSKKNIIESALIRHLPSIERSSSSLIEAMQYGVQGAGKRLRPLLVYATGEALEVHDDLLSVIATAVEYIHCYSLIHDDLPAMDNDDLRRGKPTCHRAFNQGIAILAGDALQTLAFDILATDPPSYTNPATRLALIKNLAQACGATGMAQGQAIDIESSGKILSLSRLQHMHSLKTAKLLQACLTLPLLAASNAPSTLNEILSTAGLLMGLAFQVKDDILDIEADTTILGKKQFADIEQNKSTFPKLLGLHESRRYLFQLHQQAMKLLEPLDERFNVLRQLFCHLIERQH